MELNIEREIDSIMVTYYNLVGDINSKAKGDISRAYGGIVRSGKAGLGESIGRQLTKLAWVSLGGKLSDLEVKKEKIKIPINEKYLERLNGEVKKHIVENFDKHVFPCGVDWHIYVKGNFVVGLECKTYTENAMMKRILVDFTLLKTEFPNLGCILLQLESQLGGDYSDVFKDIKVGSFSTHTLLSFFDVDLKIVTLLEGERKVKKPIHKADYFKPLKRDSLFNAMNEIGCVLKEYK